MAAVTTFTNLPVATALNGTEITAIVQAGVSVQTSLAQIALLPLVITVTSFSGGSTGLTPAAAASGAIVLGGTLVPANGGTGVTGFGQVTAYTSNQTITAAQSYQTFSNMGATGQITLEMPTPAAGLEYTFIAAAAQNMILDVGGSVVIGLGEIATSPGGQIACNSPYSSVTLKALSSTLWVATSLIGTWTPV